MTDPTDPTDPLELVERAAAELVPQLTERLARNGLGEIEVRHGELRVRVARALEGVPPTAPARAGAHAAGLPTDRVGVVPSGPSHQGVTSPAVGFFVYADGLGPGLPVDKGDELGIWHATAPLMVPGGPGEIATRCRAAASGRARCVPR